VPIKYEFRARCNWLRRLVISLILVGQLAACRKPTAQDVLGSWQVGFANSKLKLTLNPDGTFEEILEKKQDTSVRRTGRWELTELEGESVVLHGALIARNYAGTVESDNRNGEWIMHVDRAFGRFRLLVNEDLNIYFERSRQ
jgi:hypothetical protein